MTSTSLPVTAPPQTPATVRGSAAQERPVRSRLQSVAVGLGLLAVIVLPALTFPAFWLFLAAQVAAYAIATLGLNVLYGRTGQLSLAQATFMGAGAYTGYVLGSRGHAPLVQLLAVCAVSLVVGAVVAIPTLRLSGLRLALVTLAVGELFAWVLVHTTDLTGGTQGANVEPLVIGPLDAAVPLFAYVLGLVPALLATALVLHLDRTQLGRRMLLVRDSELAARATGVPIIQTKITAFLLASVFAGVAGWLYGGINGFVSPPDFNLFASVYLLVAVVIGGARSVLGAWVGAAYIVVLPQVFTAVGIPNLYALVGGALLALVALLAPDGLVGLARSAANRRRRTA